MAEGHRNYGCFKCGNTLHKSWECPVHLEHKEQIATRHNVQEAFFLTHPEKKAHQGAQRADKYRAKQVAKSRASNSEVRIFGNFSKSTAFKKLRIVNIFQFPISGV
jgi:hypothetical protein